jgi:hypothetical protein
MTQACTALLLLLLLLLPPPLLLLLLVPVHRGYILQVVPSPTPTSLLARLHSQLLLQGFDYEKICMPSTAAICMPQAVAHHS